MFWRKFKSSRRTGRRGNRRRIAVRRDHAILEFLERRTFLSATISDFVWEDLNGNGIQDDGEPGIAGATVNLLDDAGQQVDTTVTDGNGLYEFIVDPGDYRVEFPIPDGFDSYTLFDQAGDAVNSDASPTNGRTELLTVADEEVRDDIDAGFFAEGAIYGYKFEDENNNGVDNDEPRLRGVRVYLDLNNNGVRDRGEPTDRTDANGRYAFEGLDPGEYRVREEAPRRFAQTTENPDPIDLESGMAVVGDAADPNIDPTLDVEVDGDLAFGNTRSGQVRGTKFEDENGNGVQDRGDSGLAGVTVYVDLNNNNQFDDGRDGGIVEPSAVTNGRGRYTIDAPPGTFDVREVVPDGFVQTFPTDAANGEHEDIVITAGGVVADLDFGNYRQARIEGLKFDDLDGDGRFDRNEPGVEGVTVRLFTAGVDGELGTGDDVEVAATVTDANGDYVFEDVDPGDYFVAEDTPAGTVRTLPDDGYAVTVTSGDIVTRDIRRKALNFGNVTPATLSGVKFHDLNANGVKDDGEEGIAGVTIFLDANRNGRLGGTEVSTVTNGDGEYEFEVAPGRHNIAEVVQDGFVQSLPDAAARGRYTRTVISGQEVEDLDFGNYEPVVISGTKYEDLNGDGDQDEGEDGIRRVVIFADRNANGVLDRGEESARTDANGDFELTVVPGEIVLLEVVPRGFVGTEGADGYEIDVVSGSDPITDRDFGNARPGTISGIKFEDEDGNGQRNGGENRLSGVTVFLDLNQNGEFDEDDEPSAVTDRRGAYSFSVAPGTYDVREVLPTGFVQTAPAGDFHDDVVVDSGDRVGDLDFGNQRIPKIEGLKFDDLDGDGRFDDGEPGVEGVTIRLFSAGVDEELGTEDDVEEAATVTDADGTYVFEGIALGEYFITEDVPGGAQQSLPADPDVGYAVNVANTQPVTRDVNGDLLHFGNFTQATLSGVKFEDDNANGVKDDGEDGIAGVTIFLDANGNGVLDGGEVSTDTDGDGAYTFDVDPGQHTVAEVVPDGFVQTLPNTRDRGRYVETVTSGQEVEDLDFGNYEPIEISGVKYNDIDGDGEQDENEDGVRNVTIFVDRNGNGRLDRRTEEFVRTDATGAYTLVVAPGAFRVTEVIRRGFVQTDPFDPADYDFDVESGDGPLTDIDFGNVRAGQIRGTVFNDVNGNGQREDVGLRNATEPGIENVRVFVDLNDNGEFDEGEPFDLTDRFGRYQIDAPPGTNDVIEVLPDGFQSTTPLNPIHEDVTVESRGRVSNLDFGNENTENDADQANQQARVAAALSRSSSARVASAAAAWSIGSASLDVVEEDTEDSANPFALGGGS